MNNLIKTYLNIASHLRNKDFISFKCNYFYIFNIIIGVGSALGTLAWIAKDYIILDLSDFYRVVIFRILPALLLPLYLIIKDKNKTWIISLLIIWMSALGAVFYSLAISNSTLTGDGYITYYVLFFMISLTIPRQILIVLSDIVYTLLVVLSSSEYFGTVIYAHGVWRPMSTGLIIAGGLALASFVMRYTVSSLYDVGKKLNEASKKDSLSGLYNRYKLDDITVNDCLPQPSTIMIIDIDKFKSINDTLGHAAGDEAILYASAILKKICRYTDTLIRYGGDEFVIIFDGIVDPQIIFNRIKSFLRDEKNKFNLTFSIGVYNCTKEDLNLENAIKKADKALYCSKESGRDRITTFHNSKV